MFKDEHRGNVWDRLRQCDLRAFADKLTPELFGQAAQKAGVRIGLSALNLANLVWLGLASALRPGESFATVLVVTLKILYDSQHWSTSPIAQAQRAGQRRRTRRKGRRRKHDPRSDDPTQLSEEAFCKARQKMPLGFWMALIALLAGRFEAQHAPRLRWKHYRLLALDGTLVNLTRHKALARHFGTARNGKGRGKTPQARMVMLQFPTTRVPLSYELGTLAESEKTLAGKLLAPLRPDDLLLMDRGFWSYGLFWQIQNQGAFFGVRRFQSAKLLPCKRLSANEQLVWYAPSDRKWRRANLPRQMLLRLIDYHRKGFRPSQLVTNVLDPKAISRAEWVQMAEVGPAGQVLREPGLYHRRWEIEITYLELKKVQRLGTALRSRTPASISYEIAGQVTLYLLLRWMLVEAATPHGIDPLRLSFTDAWRDLTDMLPKLLLSSPRHVARVLLPRLLKRLAQHRVPLRPGRHYPRPNDTKVKNKGHGKHQHPSKLSPTQTKAA